MSAETSTAGSLTCDSSLLDLGCRCTLGRHRSPACISVRRRHHPAAACTACAVGTQRVSPCNAANEQREEKRQDQCEDCALFSAATQLHGGVHAAIDAAPAGEGAVVDRYARVAAPEYSAAAATIATPTTMNRLTLSPSFEARSEPRPIRDSRPRPCREQDA